MRAPEERRREIVRLSGERLAAAASVGAEVEAEEEIDLPRPRM